MYLDAAKKQEIVGRLREALHDPSTPANALPSISSKLAEFDERNKGITFKENTIRRNEEGKITFIYLDGDIAGFSFHLTV